ncbi:hypothetical protein PGTUg99_016026 [Puccinia graminis f. sp. tritici]|uniref:Uncharacterized protein n=1 Tax=Puccinia graminis f. sp. tritici TaxID=56615 RepID=A0A5B0M235_PUCGR|nr:hypothetical protein PGTUg99_002715 [Puccinia graminis f. sp. tritici]KAA1137453.1 hypothetical protein PGTUg99_016026 [Puccinia graminis f. sp. tritici]
MVLLTILQHNGVLMNPSPHPNLSFLFGAPGRLPPVGKGMRRTSQLQPVETRLFKFDSPPSNSPVV